MKESILLALLLVLVFAVAGRAQDDFYSSRLETAANDLKRHTVELAERTSEDMRRASANTRSAIEEAFLAQQLDAGTGLFQRMINDRRRAAELRDAAALLSDLARRAPDDGSNSNLWRSVQDSLNNINRELGNAGGNDGGGNRDDRPTTGRVFWRGMVDHHLALVIRGSTLETRLLSGKSYPEGTYSFTTPFPNREVTVEVNKTKGRGTVRVVQQPSPANDFTTVIEIKDSDGGAKEYQLDIFWK